MGNKAKCTPMERGTVVFQTTVGNKIRATIVLHVLCLGMNLLSASQLQNKGYDVYFICKGVYVKHSSSKKKAQIRVGSNKMYKLQLESPMELIGNNDEKDLNELWHRRMGHLHPWSSIILKKTVTRVFDLSTKRDDVCKGCVLGKYAKADYPRSNNSAKTVLGLIHLDICGPMSTIALSGAEYFVTFIDDHSKKTWIYFLKTKDEVFVRFKEFKALVENLTGKKIKILRSENGGEYIDKNFTEFCAREGIRREWTALYNSELNELQKGRIELLWRLQGQCCMLKTCPTFCGQKLVIQLYMFRTRFLTAH